MIENTKKTTYIGRNVGGFLLIEIIIAVALISIVFITLLGVGVITLNVSNSIQKETQADSLVKEEFEALRSFRDGTTWATNGLGTVNTGNSNPYHLVNDSDEWVLVAGAETKGIFTRQVIFDKVSRDSAGNVEYAYNSSNDDADTRKITVTVSWRDRSIQTVSYFTNWKQ